MAFLEMNVSVTPKMDNTLENSIIIQNHILEMGGLEKGQRAQWGKIGNFVSQYNEGANEL